MRVASHPPLRLLPPSCSAASKFRAHDAPGSAGPAVGMDGKGNALETARTPRDDTVLLYLAVYHAPHPESLVRSVNFLEFVTPKQNSKTVVVILWANCLQPPFSIFDLGSF